MPRTTSPLRSRHKFRVRTDLAAEPVFRLHSGLLFSLDQSGVLHLSSLDAAAHFDRRRAGRDRRASRTDRDPDGSTGSRISTSWLTGAQAVFAVVGVLVAAALGWGLWDSRHLPFVSDVGTLLAHRGVGDYTLSMSHFFDLTGPSFAALRLPAVLAAVALLVGPAVGWLLRLRESTWPPHSAWRSPPPSSSSPRTSPSPASSRCSAPNNSPTRSSRRLSCRLLHHLWRPIRRLLGHLLHP